MIVEIDKVYGQDKKQKDKNNNMRKYAHFDQKLMKIQKES